MIWIYFALAIIFMGCCCWRVKKKDVTTQTDKRVSFIVPAIIDNYVTATDETERASAPKRRRKLRKYKSIDEKELKDRQVADALVDRLLKQARERNEQ